jgi:hypothetical protein
MCWKYTRNVQQVQKKMRASAGEKGLYFSSKFPKVLSYMDNGSDAPVARLAPASLSSRIACAA